MTGAAPIKLTAIAAMAANRVIGVDNDLPWSLPEDLKFFRDTTKGAVMIMGRKTFESLGKPLPGRYHVVITRNADYRYEHERVKIVESIDKAIDFAKTLVPTWPSEVFVVGGGEIYKQSLHLVDKIYLTRIERDYQGAAHFPEFESGGGFRLAETRPATTNTQPPTAETPHYRFETWNRI
ncbi:MAG: dihydrofolate reductase [Bdellovibrionaceae bacterium]|nr:dihydrofolate reductase [Pseudobdellovibrionaceae bacterium]